jgi:hypothetical protein
MKTELIVEKVAYMIVGVIFFCLAMILIEIAKNPERITFGHF